MNILKHCCPKFKKLALPLQDRKCSLIPLRRVQAKHSLRTRPFATSAARRRFFQPVAAAFELNCTDVWPRIEACFLTRSNVHQGEANEKFAALILPMMDECIYSAASSSFCIDAPT